jgi:predicted DNA-binding antitoxin AbrB/MazE fold protein
MKNMGRNVEVVDENAVLRPLEILQYPEHERLTIVVPEQDDDPLAAFIDREFLQAAAEDMQSLGPVPTLGEVQAILSRLSGSLSADIISGREDRI